MAAPSTRCGKYFFLRSQQNRDMVAEVKQGIDKPGAPVVIDEARTEEAGNVHQLWHYDKSSNTLRNKLNGFCLDINENIAVVNPYRRGRTSQQFACSDDKIQSLTDFELVLGLDGRRGIPGTSLVQQEQEGELSECWSFEYRPPEYFYIRSQDAEMVLDIAEGNTWPGAKIILYKDTGKMADNQLWYEDDNGVIRSKLNDLAFDSSGKSTVTQKYDPNKPSMQWVPHDNTIRNRTSPNLVLEIKTKKIDKAGGFGRFGRIVSGAFGDHPDIQQAEFLGNVNQLWTFDPIPAAGISLSHSGNGKHFLARNRDNGMVVEVQQGQGEPDSPLLMAYKNFDARNMDHQLFYEHLETQTIRSALNDYCWDINDGTVILSPYNKGRSQQKWHVYGKRIQSVEDPDLVLEVPADSTEPGSYVTAAQYSGTENQHWEIGYQPAKHFYIISHLNGRCMDVNKGSSAAGTKVIMFDRSPIPSPNQMWHEDERGIIRSKLNGFVLDSSDSYIELQPYNPSNRNSQYQISGEYIVNKAADNACIDISKGSKKNGAKLCAWKIHGNTNQKWTFLPV